ncbi:MAG: hypothetical protein V1874_00780 [Spirochaetota bacterium]
MYKITAIALFLFACIKAYADMPVDFVIKSEYKKDTIEYNDITRYYYRERLSILFSEESSLNVSCIYLKKEKDKKYTWNLLLKDISPCMSFYLGNYFVSFGSGLLAGAKRTYDPDIYSIKISNPETADINKTFTPCNTGNPVFAFNGIAGSSRLKLQDLNLSLNAFYSIKERFIDENSYESNQISGTMDTVDGKIGKAYNQNEPVEIQTYGLMLSAGSSNSILLQTYFLNASIHSRYKEEIVWEYNEESGESNSISNLNGFGLYAQYKDDFLKIILDGAMTQKETLHEDNTRNKDNGFGILYSLRFTPPFVAIEIAGKEMNSSFYSPYGSSIGEDYPESAWFFNTAIKPYSNFILNAKASSEKKKAPSSTDNTMPVIKKETISLAYFFGKLEKLEIALKRTEKTNDETVKNQQVQASTKIAITDAIKSLLSGTTACRQNNPSKILSAGFELLVAGYMKFYIHYIVASISDNYTSYIVVSPIRDSSTKGFFIKEDSNIVVIKSDIEIKNIFFSCRYLYQFTRSHSLHSRLEFIASGLF